MVPPCAQAGRTCALSAETSNRLRSPGLRPGPSTRAKDVSSEEAVHRRSLPVTPPPLLFSTPRRRHNLFLRVSPALHGVLGVDHPCIDDSGREYGLCGLAIDFDLPAMLRARPSGLELQDDDPVGGLYQAIDRAAHDPAVARKRERHLVPRLASQVEVADVRAPRYGLKRHDRLVKDNRVRGIRFVRPHETSEDRSQGCV